MRKNYKLFLLHEVSKFVDFEVDSYKDFNRFTDITKTSEKQKLILNGTVLFGDSKAKSLHETTIYIYLKLINFQIIS